MGVGRVINSTVVLAVLAVSVSLAYGDNPVITSFSENGRIQWTYPTNGVKEYRIEWCSDIREGLWCDMESGIRGIAPTNDTLAVSVPMYYRIRAMGPTPTNMAYIPAGWFDMGNCKDPAEGYSDELPVHRVYVGGFYMDKYEVTKALWDEVYVWATNNGYAFDNVGSGKATNHPVHTVDWYDAVKWCNARSEKEGLTPAYYTDSTTTTVYRIGETNIEANCVNWSRGYRLPTDAEWEKAARGGVGGQRFPWNDSDTIQHARANYYSHASYSYDTSPTRGYPPAYATGDSPYTSPVGSYAANGYGLYDMAGNLWEWCHDWFPGYEGSRRALRSGSWASFADYCRVADRIYYYPVSEYFYVGFRTVLPPGQ